MNDTDAEHTETERRTVLKPSPTKLVFRTLVRLLFCAVLLFGFMEGIHSNSKDVGLAVVCALVLPLVILSGIAELTDHIIFVQEWQPDGSEKRTIIDKNIFAEHKIPVSGKEEVTYVSTLEQLAPRSMPPSYWRISTIPDESKIYCDAFAKDETHDALCRFCNGTMPFALMEATFPSEPKTVTSPFLTETH